MTVSRIASSEIRWFAILFPVIFGTLRRRREFYSTSCTWGEIAPGNVAILAVIRQLSGRAEAYTASTAVNPVLSVVLVPVLEMSAREA
jgi:hypothetical protein